MFYICGKKGNMYGIVDTEDNVLEFYTKEQIAELRGRGFNIIDKSNINEIVYYVWHFAMNTSEFGSDEFEQILDFMEGNSPNRFGGSRHDYVNSLKQNYLEVKKLGFDITPSDMFSTSDMLVKDLIILYQKNSRLATSECEPNLKRISSKWHLDYEFLKKYYV